mmetsp:Transcript_49934/g.139829  ORF Transcript_49934/g.139829 Transcript_49934/m.139829 type:complete len:212 (+) Transcript_49934:901-1536(+)
MVLNLNQFAPRVFLGPFRILRFLLPLLQFAPGFPLGGLKLPHFGHCSLVVLRSDLHVLVKLIQALCNLQSLVVALLQFLPYRIHLLARGLLEATIIDNAAEYSANAGRVRLAMCFPNVHTREVSDSVNLRERLRQLECDKVLRGFVGHLRARETCLCKDSFLHMADFSVVSKVDKHSQHIPDGSFRQCFHHFFCYRFLFLDGVEEIRDLFG